MVAHRSSLGYCLFGWLSGFFVWLVLFFTFIPFIKHFLRALCLYYELGPPTLQGYLLFFPHGECPRNKFSWLGTPSFQKHLAVSVCSRLALPQSPLYLPCAGLPSPLSWASSVAKGSPWFPVEPTPVNKLAYSLHGNLALAPNAASPAGFSIKNCYFFHNPETSLSASGDGILHAP